jgi:hypothetical protein
MDRRGSSWVVVDPHGSSWILMDRHGFSWILADPIEQKKKGSPTNYFFFVIFSFDIYNNIAV